MLGDGKIKSRIIILLIIVLELRKTWIAILYYNVFKEINEEYQKYQNIQQENKDEIVIPFSEGSLNQGCLRSQLLIQAAFQPPADCQTAKFQTQFSFYIHLHLPEAAVVRKV